jgi:hypothetical protein
MRISKMILGGAAIAAAGVLSSVPGWATSIGNTSCSTQDLCSYVITMPTIVNGVETSSTAQFDITFANGPFGAMGSNLVSYSFSGSPLPGGSADSEGYPIAWTSATETISNSQDLELVLEYSDGGGNLLAFDFIEPYSFWSLTGQQSFASDAGVTAYGLQYYDPNNPSNEVWGTTNVGSSYFYVADGAVSDPVCDQCSVSVSAVTVTPEPGSLWLLGTGLVGLAGMMRRKLGQNA